MFGISNKLKKLSNCIEYLMVYLTFRAWRGGQSSVESRLRRGQALGLGEFEVKLALVIEGVRFRVNVEESSCFRFKFKFLMTYSFRLGSCFRVKVYARFRFGEGKCLKKA